MVQRTVALSTTEAEYMAGTEATKEAIWILSLLSQICANKTIKCILRGDNQGSLALVSNPIFHQSVGSTPHKSQDYGKTAGCNKAWNGTANNKQKSMDT